MILQHRQVWLFQSIDFVLQIFQESACVGTVHLGVMELEGNGQGISEQLFPVTAPEDKGIVENAAVHAYNAVDFCIHNGGSADDHAVFGQVIVLAGLGDLGGVGEIIAVELCQIIGMENVAGADFAGFVFDDGVYCNGIIFHQLVTDGQEIELLDSCGCFADAVVQKHIEFQMLLPGDADQVGHIQGFEKCDHGIGSVHPEFESGCAGGQVKI